MGQINLQHVTKRFENGHDALVDLSVEFEEGSMTFLTGHSGAGKSTLMKILSGVIRDYDGQVKVRGQVSEFRGTRDADPVLALVEEEILEECRMHLDSDAPEQILGPDLVDQVERLKGNG